MSSHPLFQISSKTSQIITGFLIELAELCILLLQVFKKFNMFCLIQLIGQVLVFLLDPIQLPFDYDQFFIIVLQSSLHYF